MRPGQERRDSPNRVLQTWPPVAVICDELEGVWSHYAQHRLVKDWRNDQERRCTDCLSTWVTPQGNLPDAALPVTLLGRVYLSGSVKVNCDFAAKHTVLVGRASRERAFVDKGSPVQD